jgi:putative endopeptidase
MWGKIMRRFGMTLGWAGLALLASAATAEDAGKPMYGSWGVDLTAIDASVSPGDDFFGYASGTWLRQTPIPPDKPSVSLRVAMTDRIQARLKDLLESSAAQTSSKPADLSGKAGAFYKAFMDEAHIESLGITPIESQLATVRAAKSRTALAALMGRSNTDFYSSLFAASIDVDLKDPSHYALYLNQSGLGLPDRDYYLQPTFAKQRAAYQLYIAQLLQGVHWPNADDAARDVLAFETQVAEVSWSAEQDRDIAASYNPMRVTELVKFASGFDWRGYLLAQRVPDMDRLVVAEKSAFPKIVAVFSSAPIETLQAWQAFHVADNAAPYLPQAFAQGWFELHEKALAGQQEPRARWRRAITAVGGDDFLAAGRFGSFGTMGWGVGQLYSAKYFPPQSKAKIEDLIHHLVQAYRVRLEKLDWMSPATRAEALKKLNTYTIKVGYPDHPRNYAPLTMTDDDLVGDVQRAAAFDWAFLVGRSHGPVDKSDWGMTPQTNDAYNGALRDIVFPAGILQPPIFDPNADPAVNYGSVGAVIGHELTHGFDDQGRKLDANGALRDWWAPEDAIQFDARAARLGAQYSQFLPLPDEPEVHVNGELTMGENIADLGGVTLALDAYRASLQGQPSPLLDGLTGDQRVFLGWAQAWRGKVTPDAIKRGVASDPHSPRQFRVNGVVRNIDAWYEAFDVRPGDKLYLKPDERVHIW